MTDHDIIQWLVPITTAVLVGSIFDSLRLTKVTRAVERLRIEFEWEKIASRQKWEKEQTK